MAELSYLPESAKNADEVLAFKAETQPGYTFKLDISRGRTKGTTDEIDAYLQAVYLTLNVERYAFQIYSYNYGVELEDLIGKPKDYVMSECKRRITEALMQDDRTLEVGGWTFETGKKSITAHFVIKTIYGDVAAEKEVDV